MDTDEAASEARDLIVIPGHVVLQLTRDIDDLGNELQQIRKLEIGAVADERLFESFTHLWTCFERLTEAYEWHTQRPYVGSDGRPFLGTVFGLEHTAEGVPRCFAHVPPSALVRFSRRELLSITAEVETARDLALAYVPPADEHPHTVVDHLSRRFRSRVPQGLNAALEELRSMIDRVEK